MRDLYPEQSGGGASRKGGGGSTASQQPPADNSQLDSDGTGDLGDASGKGGGGVGKNGRQGGNGDGQGDQASSADNDVDLESAKKATYLVLKQLDRELSRGEVYDEWMKKHGWTEEELRKFVDRMQKELHTPRNDASPEAQARRVQFEEMLKNLTLETKPKVRQGSDKLDSELRGTDVRRSEAPREYRSQWEAYTTELMKRRQNASRNSSKQNSSK